MEFIKLVWKTGNSLVITLPQNLIEEQSLTEGDHIILEFKRKVSLKK